MVFRIHATLTVISRKYFLSSLGHDGLNKLLAGYEDKTIFAVCTFAYCAGPDSDVILFQGRTEGKLVPARGPPNFGWDPCFEYQGKTYAEMDKDEKVSLPGYALRMATFRSITCRKHFRPLLCPNHRFADLTTEQDLPSRKGPHQTEGVACWWRARDIVDSSLMYTSMYRLVEIMK